MILSSLTKICQNRPNNKLKFCENQLKKVDFRKNLDPIWNLVLKRVSKFVIPQFRDTLLVPKITKCEDLLQCKPPYYFFSKVFYTKICDYCISAKQFPTLNSTLVANSNDPPRKYCILDVIKGLINQSRLVKTG